MPKTLYLLPVVLLFLVPSAEAQPLPTWSENVACLVYTHCASCHRPEGIAPFSLLEYTDAAPLAGLIEHVVSSEKMPPWPPDHHFSSFVGERVLTDNEILVFKQWAFHGAPKGDSTFTPTPPVLDVGWAIDSPELSVRFQEYTINSVGGEDDFRCLVEPTGLATDQFITAMEVVPGNAAALHHGIVFAENTGGAALQDSLEPGPGYFCYGGPQTSDVDYLVAYAPGVQPLALPDGMGIRMKAGADLVLNAHYPYYAAGAVDSTRVNFRLSSDSTLRLVRTRSVLHHARDVFNLPFAVLPDQVRTIYQRNRLSNDQTVLAVGPHAHSICRSMTMIAQKPDGEIVPLIDIPEWDPGWQGFYSFKKPVILPKHTKIYGRAVFDNTDANPNNPNSPPQLVTGGTDSDDEMMVFMMVVTGYLPGDEDLVVDSTSSTAYHDACDPYTGLGSPAMREIAAGWIEVLPNPASDRITIDLPDFLSLEDPAVQLFNLSGHLVLERSIKESGKQDISLPDSFRNGLYLLRIIDPASAFQSLPFKLMILR